MKIIDVHAHLGDDCVFDHHIKEEDLLNGYEATPVTGAIVQPSLPRFPCRQTRRSMTVLPVCAPAKK